MLLQEIKHAQQRLDGMRLIYRCGQRLFAQFFARLIHCDRQVQVLRNTQAKQTLQVYLARRGIQQVRAAHDMRDVLERIVDYNGQLIGEQTIRALHHEIADFAFKVLGYVALQGIRKLYF